MVNIIPSNTHETLNLTLLQMLQEHDENQNTVDQLQCALQSENAGNNPHLDTLQDINDKLEKTEDEIQVLQSTLEKVKTALKCSSCNEVTRSPIVSGMCGHLICQECQDKKLLDIFEASTKEEVSSKIVDAIFMKILCPIRNCNRPTLGLTIPVRSLQTITSLLESKGLISIHPKKLKTALKPSQKEKAQYWLTSYYSRAILGSTSAVSILDKVPPKKWSEGVAVRLDWVSTIFVELFKKAFIKQTLEVACTIDYNPTKRIFLIQNNPEQTNSPAPPILNKSLFVVDVLEDGSHKMEQMSLPVNESKIPQFPYVKFSPIKEEYYAHFLSKMFRLTLHTNARLSALNKMGRVDDQTLTWLSNSNHGAKVIYRIGVFSEPTVALVTNYLSNISPSDNELYSGSAGLELVAEGLQKEVGTDPDSIANSFLCRLIYAASQVVEKRGAEIRKALAENVIIVLPVKINVPYPYANAEGKSYALIGIKNPSVPEDFSFEQKKILLATVRLLTLDEVKNIEHISRTKGKITRETVGTFHLSSLIPTNFMPKEMDVKERNQNTQNPKFQTTLEEFKINNAEKYASFIDSIKKELAQQVNLGPSQTLLPSIDENYKPPIDCNPQFEKFADPSSLKDALQELYQTQFKSENAELLQLLAQHLICLFGRQYTYTLSLKFETYFKNPHLHRASENLLATNALSTQSYALVETGKKLISHLMQRFEWAIEIQKGEKKSFNIKFCLMILAADEKWIEESILFLKKTGLQLATLTSSNRRKAVKFRTLLSQYMPWPHSELVLKEIQNAGFQPQYSATMHDRCVCNICSTTVAHWRPWITPWKMHDFTKHTDQFRELAEKGKA